MVKTGGDVASFADCLGVVPLPWKRVNGAPVVIKACPNVNHKKRQKA